MVDIPKGSQAYENLKEDLTRMGCVGLLEASWKFTHGGAVEGIMGQGVAPPFTNTLRGNCEKWTAEHWREASTLS